MFLLFFSLFYLELSRALLISTESRVSTRNITCLNGSSATAILFNCEVCLVIARNYDIRTLLSVTGNGPLGLTFKCLQANQIEAYRENLVRECSNFPQESMNGYDDFCIASPYSKQRGSYRACMCATNACNFNYSECVQHGGPYWSKKPPLLSNSVVQLRDRVKCYRPYEDYKPSPYSSLAPLCSSNDEECKNFLFDHGVLCAISVDRTQQISRVTLPPSIYTAYLMKYKTQLCNSFTWKSKSIYFAQCAGDETVCMCTVDGCDKDLETCQASKATNIYLYTIFYLLAPVIHIYL